MVRVVVVAEGRETRIQERDRDVKSFTPLGSPLLACRYQRMKSISDGFPEAIVVT